MKSRIIIGLILLPFGIKAQHYAHTTFWSKIAITTPLSKKWDFQMEYVHRSQNDYHESKWNPFKRESLEEPRLWFNWRHKNITVQLNPISYIYSKPLLGNEKDYFITPNREWRTAVGLETRQTAAKWIFKERVQYEYRWLKILNYGATSRLRLRGTLQYEINAKTKAQCFSEIFINTPPHKAKYSYDTQWTLVGISRQISPKFTMDLGYMRNWRKRVTGVEFDDENALNLGLNFRL